MSNSPHPWMSAVRGITLLALGQLASRAAALLILVLYAKCLGPSAFGELEQLLAVSLFLVPLASMQVYEAFLSLFLRDRVAGFTVASCGAVSATVVLIAGAFCVALWNSELAHAATATAVHAASTILWQLMRNVLRSKGAFGVVMAADHVQAAASLTLALLLVDSGLAFLGALVAIAVGNLCASLVALVSGGLWVLWDRHRVTVDDLKGVLSVAGRLLPNVLLWWGIEFSDRVLLAHFLGDKAVGVYAAGARIAGLLMIGALLLYQVWQVPAIRALDLPLSERARFFSRSLRGAVLAIGLGASILLALTQPLVALLGVDYASSIRFAAVLVPALSLAALCYFFGVAYYAATDRPPVIPASVVGLVVSFGANVVLIPSVGSMGAAWASLLAYLSILLVRSRHVSRRLGGRLAWWGHLAPIGLVALQAVALYRGAPAWVLWLGVVAFLLVAYPGAVTIVQIDARERVEQ